MANQFNANCPAKIQTLLNSIRSALNGVDMDFKDAVGCRITLTVSPDGQVVILETMSADQGQSNRFGPADASGRLTRVAPKSIPITSLP